MKQTDQQMTFHVLGKPVKRLDAFDKVTGRTKFGGDLYPPGMLHARVLRSPHPHAHIHYIDTSKAERLLGVRAVLTGRHTPMIKFGMMIKDEYIMAVDKVRFVGEEVVAVVAIDEDTAEEALELIRVEYEPLPAVLDVEEAIREGAPLVHENAPGNIAYQYKATRGDPDQGWGEAKVVVEGTFRTPSSHQGYMETLNAVASYENGRVTIWAPSQSPFRDRDFAGDALGLSYDRVRFIQTFVGGGFGGKHGQRVPALCAFLATQVDRPVRLCHSRDEEFFAGRPRESTVITMRLGFREDGLLVAKHAKVLCDNGAYTCFSPRILDTVTRRCDNLYRQKNLLNEAKLIYTNKSATGAFRGFGNPEGTFALESLMDEGAEKLGMDPLEVRLKNATRAGDVTVHGWKPQSCALSECFEKATDRIGWKDKRGRKKTGRDQGKLRRGVGIAGLIHVCGRRQSPKFYGSNAIITVDGTGSVTLLTGETDVGQGCGTTLAQLAAEEIGVPFDRMRVVPNVDTDTSPLGFGTFSDRVTHVGGNAVVLAAADAKRQVLEVAAEMLDSSLESLEIYAGLVRVKGAPTRAVSFQEVARYAAESRDRKAIVGRGTYDPPSEFPDPKTMAGNISDAYAFGAQAFEVEVNTETGEVKILKVVSVHDVGRLINPMAAASQIEGALGQGLGFALLEELVYKDGRVLNPALLPYGVVRSTGMPPLEVHFIESIDPTGPFGAKGLAEPAIVPTAPAIASAIFDAVGVRPRELPMTRANILRLLANRESTKS